MTNQNEKPATGYRGGLVYRQEYGYKLITMTISLRTHDEHSRVVSCASGLDITEEAEHIPSIAPLAAVDLYHFAATDGTEILLTIKSQAGEHQARYTVQPDGVQEDSPFLWLDLVRSSESIPRLLPNHDRDDFGR
jgi:hypothetical protein